jgi:hypothetical protein
MAISNVRNHDPEFWLFDWATEELTFTNLRFYKESKTPWLPKVTLNDRLKKVFVTECDAEFGKRLEAREAQMPKEPVALITINNVPLELPVSDREDGKILHNGMLYEPRLFALNKKLGIF